MDRRKALKDLSLSFGYVVAAPTVFKLLSSCNYDDETWQPLFFSKQEKFMVTQLVAIILPKSEIPGGIEVNVPQFMDLMYQDIEREWNQKSFQKGAQIFQEKFKNQFNKEVLKGNNEEIQQLFEHYFKLSDQDTQRVLNKQKLKENEVSVENKPLYYIYKFLFSVRYYTLFGYYTSKKVGKEVLNYDPFPGVYQGCVPIDEIGNGWALEHD